MTRWQELAVCRGRTREWFPDDERDLVAIAKAKRGCAVCPVRVDCLTAAVDRAEEHGVWAGATDDELRHLRRAFNQRTGPARPLPYRAEDPWSQAVAVHLDQLDTGSLGAVDIAEQTQLALPGAEPVPRLIPVDRGAGGPCARCGAPTQHRDAVDRNGPGAQCGKTSTYGRGCACLPCREARLARTDGPTPTRTPQLAEAHP